jgi:diacylglycerol kinase (ATP)
VRDGQNLLPRKPPRTHGIAHLIAATGYSLSGLRRLWQEASFRQEVLGGGAALLILWLLGASAGHLLILLMLLLALLAVEALNTAIEVIVDHLSPDWSLFAKQAKDAGSAAVLMMIVINAIWVAVTLYHTLSP